MEWQTFELRPKPLEQLDPVNDSSKLSLWQQVIYPRITEWGVDMKLPNVSPHPYTDLAHEGFYFAKEHGKANEYNNRVYEAFFQEDKNIREIEVLTELAKDVSIWHVLVGAFSGFWIAMLMAGAVTVRMKSGERIKDVYLPLMIGFLALLVFLLNIL
ncbi:DsbA family protein [Staphylococcus saprophyticus]|uniref:DsbA family protein n=1 Tax=Staphylococcus saprophyticus TaxID=29385 RepID=UPI001F21B4A4